MSAGEELREAHKAIAKGAGQIAIMLSTARISKGELEESLSSILEGADRVRGILGQGEAKKPRARKAKAR